MVYTCSLVDSCGVVTLYLEQNYKSNYKSSYDFPLETPWTIKGVFILLFFLRLLPLFLFQISIPLRLRGMLSFMVF